MVLPLIGGLIGSSLAAGGMMSMSPLLASALGSGIGAFIETGDPKDALTAGATGYLGGSMLGGMAGNALGAGSSAAPTQMAGYGPGISYSPPSLPSGGISGLMKNPEFIKGATGAVTSGLMMPQSYSSGYKSGAGGGGEEAPAPGRSLTRPRDSGSREFDYKVQPNYGLEDGGQVLDEKAIVQDAVSAIKGQHPEPEIALGRFLQMYGEDALRELVSAVKRGDMEGGKADGTVRGPMVDGDIVPARNMTDGSDVMLESGEFVMPNEAVAGIGGGDHRRGTEALYQLRDMFA